MIHFGILLLREDTCVLSVYVYLCLCPPGDQSLLLSGCRFLVYRTEVTSPGEEPPCGSPSSSPQGSAVNFFPSAPAPSSAPTRRRASTHPETFRPLCAPPRPPYRGALICCLWRNLLKLHPTVMPEGDYQLSCSFYLSTYPAADRRAQNVTEIRTKSKGIPSGVNLCLSEAPRASYTKCRT